MRHLLLLASVALGACAHEIGTTRVTANFAPDRSYEITVVTDGEALAEKIESLSGRVLEQGTATDKLLAIITGADEVYRQRVKIAFDDATDRPAISYAIASAPGPGTAPPATIRFTGRVPESARKFQWSYAWTFATYSLTVHTAGAAQPATMWLEGGRASTSIDLGGLPASGPASTLWRYISLGFTHIVPHGLDHMLFVLGIYLLSGRARTVLLQVSAFTLAHSITLALSMYGIVSISPSIVEPLIALSIAYVAIENIFLSELKSWRVALVFVFGLLHGMGFAGALGEVGLPRAEFVTALIGFNLGVEAGQLAVIGTAFLAVGWRFSGQRWYRAFVVTPASAMIACVAIYWTVERIWL